MRTFVVKVLLDGQDINDLGFRDALFGFEFRQDEFKSDIVFIDLYNEKKRHTDTNVIRERAIMDVWLGAGTKSEFLGRFILQKPKFMFPQSAVPFIRLVGLDESSKLKHAGEKRRNFYNSTDSTIVNQIASENGMLADIELTTEIREQESQLNETDLTFIARLAKRNGFVFFVENQTIHFHQVRYQFNNVKLSYGGPESNLVEFNPEKTLLNTSGIFVSTFQDKDLGTSVVATALSIDDAVVLQDTARFPTQQSASSLIIPPPTKYITEMNNNDIQTDQQSLVNRMQQRDSYILAGWGKANGETKLKARTSIEIDGIGHLSGLYYLRSVVQKFIEGEGFISYFFAARARYGLTRRVPASAGGPQVTTSRTPGSEVQPEVISEVSV